ncbi:hypothetical protein ACJX0J_022185, partial [Zea mays]
MAHCINRTRIMAHGGQVPHQQKDEGAQEDECGITSHLKRMILVLEKHLGSVEN